MAQTILVRTALTPEMISAGRRLLTHLDSEGVVFDAAFWLLDEELGEWRLHLRSGAVASDGPRVFYRRVRQALSDSGLTSVLTLEMISIADDREPLARLLVERLGDAASVDGARLDHATIGTVRLPGCLLYRLTRNQALRPAAPAA